jgi:hypothetical protein
MIVGGGPTLMNQPRRIETLFLSCMVTLFGFAVAGAAQGQVIAEFDPVELLEGDYWDSTCPVPIQVADCDSASDRKAVDGMDCEGEWIRRDIFLAGETTFYDRVRSAGDVGFVRRLEVQYLDYTTEQLVLADTLVTPPGLGIG